jgi:hypothetical protein
MVAYVPGKDNDIYISHSLADDQLLASIYPETNWMSEFSRHLEERTRERLGATVRVFPKDYADHGDTLTDELRHQVTASALMLVMLSPSYVSEVSNKNSFVAEELEAFTRDGNREGRIIVVELLPLREHQRIPPSLKRLQRERFWTTANRRPLPLTQKNALHEYNSAFERLSDRLCQRLEGLKREASTPGPILPSSLEPNSNVSIFAPNRIKAGSTALVQVFLHAIDQLDEATHLAREFDSEASRRGTRTLNVHIPVSTTVQITLAMPGLVVEPAIGTILWTGHPEAAQFSVSAPANCQLGATVGVVRVFIDRIPIGELRFKIAIVVGEATTDAIAQRIIMQRRYRRAFASYDSADRAEVLRRVQGIERVGVEVFQDVLDLKPGQLWENELYRRLDDCDVVLLFWSAAARDSEWVTREIDYILARQEREPKTADGAEMPAIEPLPIEGPPVPTPPDKLKHLHFNDALLYAIAGEDRIRGR